MIRFNPHLFNQFLIMKQQTLLKQLCLLFITVYICSSEDINAILNGDATFSPVREPGQIDNIVWKFGNDKVAEYDPSFDSTTVYYSSFKGRTTLDLKSGSITITGLTTKDEGKYSVEVNNLLLQNTFSLRLFARVENIEISSSSNTSAEVLCVLYCKAEPNSLDYKWIVDGQLRVKRNMLPVDKVDKSKSFTCIASNQASEADATVIPQDLCTGDWTVGEKVGIAFGIIGTVCAAVAVAVAVFIKRGNILGHNRRTPAAATNGTGSNTTAEEGTSLTDAKKNEAN